METKSHQTSQVTNQDSPQSLKMNKGTSIYSIDSLGGQ